MKDEQRQFLFAFGFLILILVGSFAVIVHAESEKRKLLKPCSDYSHLHESMQPVRCGKE